jgi:ATP-dependent DNA ligase
MTPMKYYQPLDYNNQKAKDMILNKDQNYIATRKNDGEWCRIIKDTDGNIKAQSRSISKVTGEYGDKTEHIPHILEEMKSFPNETVLLGELCFEDVTKTSKDVGSILRCKPDKAVARQKDVKLVFKVFDCLAFNGIDLSDAVYKDRFMSALSAIGENYNYITFTDYCLHEDYEEFLQNILAEGGEGIVIHRLDAKYKPGARTAWDTLKVKKIVEELELPIVDFIKPNKAYCGEDAITWKYWIGTKADGTEVKSLGSQDSTIDVIKWEPVTKPYWMGWYNGVIVDNNGTEVRVTSGLTDEDREWLATSEARVALNDGLVATVSCMEITDDGSLRHPRLVRIRTEA